MLGFGKKIDAAAITKEIDEGEAYLVDVRGNDEWDGLHAKGALHLSVDRIMNGEVPIKDTSKKLYLYCASGGRASMAASKLKAKGYTVENLGGLSSWKSAGGATEAGM
ncbi:rhodanese-like domain-containing protein [Candidatus Saccharibacteria bacterium]|jgi:rhodanese-related sulfurtransferase|nr:rhodanese-like domain-containing protein [Candidatus Saccharibacteria bacterium]